MTEHASVTGPFAGRDTGEHLVEQCAKLVDVGVLVNTLKLGEC